MADTPRQSEEGFDPLADCRLMLRFARESGADLSPELKRDIAQLDAMLQRLDLPSVAELPSKVTAGDFETLKRAEGPTAAAVPGAPVRPVEGAEPVLGTELALKVHGALSKLVAPATALTLRATEPLPGKHGVFARMPKIVKWSAVTALVSAIGFVISAGVIAQKAAALKAAEQKTTVEAAAEQKPAEQKPVEQKAAEPKKTPVAPSPAGKKDAETKP